MNATKRKALEAAGWKFGDAADFLEMSDDERQLLDARVSIALAIRHQREAVDLSQKELGARLKTSQPRVAKIERAAADVSLDQLVRALTAAGGRIRRQAGRQVETRDGEASEDQKDECLGAGSDDFEIGDARGAFCICGLWPRSWLTLGCCSSVYFGANIAACLRSG